MTLRTDLEASLELETLRAEVKRLREALESAVDAMAEIEGCGMWSGYCDAVAALDAKP